MSDLTGLVFDIQHFAIHDGPGIRTTVYVKGCPLRCLWCHNPEGQDPAPQLLFMPEKCISCGWCQSACQRGLHQVSGGEHLFDRAGCDGCGDCAAECYARALEVSGRRMSADQVLETVLQDAAFYRRGGGGLTVSGGEPMQQYEFTRALLAGARQAGLHTCLETSGCGATAHYREIAPLVDLFLYDVKETDDALHRQFTGASNRLILDNLRALDEAGAAILLRCPIIPGLNDRAEHFAALGALASRLRGVVEVQVMAYHPLGRSKAERLGIQPALGEIARPTDEQVRGWVAAIQSATGVRVAKG